MINTKLLRSAFGSGGAPVIDGARRLTFAAIAPALENVSGKYFVDNISTSSSKFTYDKDIQEKFWKKQKKLLE